MKPAFGEWGAGSSAGLSLEEMDTRALFGMTLGELTELMAGFGQKPYRARQLFEALYRQRVPALEAMTVLPGELRERLRAAGYAVGLPEMAQTAVSVDGTERYLMRMADGETVETVWMPDGDGALGSGAVEEDETQIPFGDDKKGEKRIPFGDDKKGEKRIPFGDDKKDEKRIPGFAGDDSKRDSGKAERGGRAGVERSDRVGGGDPDRRNWGALAPLGYRRATICISSQVGCAVNCQFCLTAKLGIRRNLTAGEIAGQVAAVLNRHGIQVGKDRINLVFMGMGEPFLNYDEFMGAVRLLVEGVGLPESRMTVSTSGILPGIERYAQEAVRPRLALSLNASNDRVREQVMPITRKWNIAALLSAVAKVPLKAREWVTFEYVLLGGVNDQPEHAREVLALLAGMRAKVNLIVWNPGPGIAYSQPEPAAVERFQQTLIEGGVATYIRRPRGRDIYAACGQLKRTVSAETALVEIAAAG